MPSLAAVLNGGWPLVDSEHRLLEPCAAAVCALLGAAMIAAGA